MYAGAASTSPDTQDTGGLVEPTLRDPAAPSEEVVAEVVTSGGAQVEDQLLPAAGELQLSRGSGSVGPGTSLSTTRVMSPNVGSADAGCILGPSRCTECNRVAQQTFVCGKCWASGHADCLRVTLVEGYAFCGACTAWALHQQRQMASEAARSQWALRLSRQLMVQRSHLRLPHELHS